MTSGTVSAGGRSAEPVPIPGVAAGTVSGYTLESLALFGLISACRSLFAVPAELAASLPHPYWIPVIVLSARHGVPGALGTVAIAVTLHILPGLPEQTLLQSDERYLQTLYLLPVLWLLGGVTSAWLGSRHAARARALQLELASANDDVRLLADALRDSLDTSRRLERRIAAESCSVAMILHDLPSLAGLRGEERLAGVAPLLARCAGASDIAVYRRTARGFVLVAAKGSTALGAPAPLPLDRSARGGRGDTIERTIAPFADGGSGGLVIVHRLEHGVGRKEARVRLDQALTALAASSSGEPAHPSASRVESALLAGWTLPGRDRPAKAVAAAAPPSSPRRRSP